MDSSEGDATAATCEVGDVLTWDVLLVFSLSNQLGCRFLLGALCHAFHLKVSDRGTCLQITYL